MKTKNQKQANPLEPDYLPEVKGASPAFVARVIGAAVGFWNVSRQGVVSHIQARTWIVRDGARGLGSPAMTMRCLGINAGWSIRKKG